MLKDVQHKLTCVSSHEYLLEAAYYKILTSFHLCFASFRWFRNPCGNIHASSLLPSLLPAIIWKKRRGKKKKERKKLN